MNKNLLILFCLFSLMQVSRAQDPIFGEPQHSTLSADSLSDVVGLIPESLDANVDSLLHSWHVQYFSKVDEYCHDDAENVYFPDSVYEERLERLPSVIRLPYNEVVRDCIDLYAGRKRDLVRYMFGMADFYFPIIEQVLDKHNLPLELKYLAVVESALNPVALSRVGACGLWQFMLPTGKIYGLEINSLLDERRDPEKAYLASKEDFDKKLDELGWSPKDLKTMAVMYIDRTEYNMKRSIRLWFQELLELLFQSAALVIDTIRTFFLIALSILGPIAFALSVYDGFQSTLTQWITRYISIYMWLPVSDLFSSVLARIQVLMLTRDIEAMSDPTFIPDSSNTVYIIFLIIGIFGYFTIPTVANWIIMAGGGSHANRAMNQTATKVGNVAAAGAGAAVGNIAGKIIK